MGPFGALDSVFTQFFSIRGRASRSEFWWFQLMNLVILLAAFFADVWIFVTDPTPVISLNPLSYFTTIWMILTVIPMFTVTIRRLHDTNKSGLWYLTFFLPFVGWIFYIVLMCIESDRGANIYGPPPYGPRGSTYDGIDPANPNVVGRRPQAHNPYAGYALVARAERPVTPEMREAQRDEIRALYQSRVLGRGAPQQS